MRPIAQKQTRSALLFLFCLTLFATSAPLAFAQETGDYGKDYDDKGDGSGNDKTAPLTARNPYNVIKVTRATPKATKSITLAITESYSFCDRAVGDEYLVDCLGEQLSLITKSMSNTGDYGEARKILEETSARLRALASANAAPNLPKVRIKSQINRKNVVTKPLTPVRKSAVKKVNAQASQIMAEAETKLLRSAANSDRRLIAYAEMAKAVGSNKTLLRSA